jgi:L-lactate dehydrogenase complex protein LldF
VNKKQLFIGQSEKKAFDLKHRETIRFNISKYDAAFEAGKQRYQRLEAAKKSASEIKRYAIRNLTSMLETFEKSAAQNGIEVLWAKDAKNAVEHLKRIAIESNVKKVVKSKSMTTEEINFNEEFEKLGIESVETDLGEFIVQMAGEKPYHILTPAMHKSRKDVAELFNRLFGTPENASTNELAAYARQHLRRDFEDAGMGVTGANFLLANEGGIAVTENEGNGLFALAFPKVHVAIAGIEKIIPSLNDLNVIWTLLACHGTGQQVSVYNSAIFAPRSEYETNGPERMIVILLDNGRSNLYAKPVQSEALICIRCGACLNSCPVYKNIGGHTYNTVYSGPIGSVIMPHLGNFKELNHLSFACSLCGICYANCPVKINLPKLLLENRREAVENFCRPLSERIIFSGMLWMLGSSKRLDMVNGSVKTFFSNLLSNKIYGKRRASQKFAKQSFRKQWVKSEKFATDKR